MEIDLQGITVEVFNRAFEVRFYSVMILAGMVAGVTLARREARRLGENPEHVLNIAVFGAALGIVGARLYHVFDQDNWAIYRANPEQILYVWKGGIGIFGAIAGALLALFLYVRWRRLNLLRWLDIGAPAFLLGQAIGRWGNYFNQELFGRPTDLPWGISIKTENVLSEAPQFAGFDKFHPLFLYESLLSFLGVAALVYLLWRFGPRVVEASGIKQLVWSSRWRLRPGDLLLLYFIWYPAERFGLEFLRASKWEQGGIPMAQWITGALVLLAIGTLIWRHRRPWGTEATGPGTEHRSRTALRRQRRRSDLAAQPDPAQTSDEAGPAQGEQGPASIP